jgi:hypothetical protein
MSILVRFTPTGMTTAQYEQVKAAVSDAGRLAPDGLQLHVCFGDEGDRRVTEVWESEAQWRSFTERLMPAIAAAGIAGAEPQVLPVRTLQVADDPHLDDDTGVVLRLRPPAMSAAQYDAVAEHLADRGLVPPRGIRAHVSMGEAHALQVGEVWASRAECDAFLDTLLPLLAQEGVGGVQPERFACHSFTVTEAARREAAARA